MNCYPVGMENKTYYRLKWKAEGKCVNCGMARDPALKSRLCGRCREQTLAYKRRTRQLRRENHQCYHCGKKLPEDWKLTKCPGCHSQSRNSASKRKAKFRAAGLCSQCGSELRLGRKMCGVCADQVREAQQKRAEKFNKAGLCRDCGKAPHRSGKQTCRPCHIENRFSVLRLRNQRVLAGLCPTCGKEKPSGGHVTCGTCQALKRDKRRALRERVFEKYGGAKCRCCGEDHFEFLEIDHVNGDGSNHRRKFPGARSICTWLRANNFPPGFQVLCRNCNTSRGKYGYCPHELERQTHVDSSGHPSGHS